MLTIEQRPATFAQLAGQKTVKTQLMHIIQDPVNAPKTLLLKGAFGTGKTTCARIFARALNCKHKLPNGDACGVCEHCKQDIQDSIFYSEYDSAVVGNVGSIRDLRNTFYFGYQDGYKVIVLDEVHLVSKTAQAALLKVFEEPEPNVFFLLCTTDPEKLLPTIVSRSFEVRFDTIPKQEVVDHLTKVCTSKGITVTDDIVENLNLIADRSHGHMRNAMMLLDSMFLLKEDFREFIQDSTSTLLQFISHSLFFNAIASQRGVDETQAHLNDILQQLTTFPIANLKQDYEKLVLDITRHTFYDKSNPEIVRLTQNFQNDFKLINILNDETIYALFKDETQFKIAMLILSAKLKNLKG